MDWLYSPTLGNKVAIIETRAKEPKVAKNYKISPNSWKIPKKQLAMENESTLWARTKMTIKQAHLAIY